MHKAVYGTDDLLDIVGNYCTCTCNLEEKENKAVVYMVTMGTSVCRCVCVIWLVALLANKTRRVVEVRCSNSEM